MCQWVVGISVSSDVRILRSEALHAFEVGCFRSSNKSHGSCEFLWRGGGCGIACIFGMQMRLYVIRSRAYSVFEE